MADTCNLGIIGCGDFVQRWQTPLLQHSERVRVIALFDTDPARAASAAKVLGGRSMTVS